MVVVVNDPEVEHYLKEQRAASGADRYDEVWEGTYMMVPIPNDQHQELVTWLGSIFQIVMGTQRTASVRVGVNVSDRKDGWMQNYRVPDVAVFLAGGKAQNCDAFWYGGPDFAVEIVSPGDQTLEKVPFYEKIGVRELLVVERDPWRLALYRLDGRLREVSEAKPDPASTVESTVIPFLFRLLPGADRPQFEVVHVPDAQRWVI